jgi:imidazole glycerol phosphate synthase subunit HisF
MPQSLNELGYLFWLCRAIGIERYDDVAASGGEATRQRVSFTDSALMDHPYIRPAALGYGDSAVIAVAIDQDHLEKVSGQARQHKWKVGSFVAGWDYHADARIESRSLAVR